MEKIISNAKRLLGRKPVRYPAETGRVVALPNAVMIWTADGNVVMSADLANSVANCLGDLVRKAKEAGVNDGNRLP